MIMILNALKPIISSVSGKFFVFFNLVGQKNNFLVALNKLFQNV